jgi:hypothetical protein
MARSAQRVSQKKTVKKTTRGRRAPAKKAAPTRQKPALSKKQNVIVQLDMGQPISEKQALELVTKIFDHIVVPAYGVPTTIKNADGVEESGEIAVEKYTVKQWSRVVSKLK